MSVVPAIEQLAESCSIKELERLAHKFLNKIEAHKKTTKQKKLEWAKEYDNYFKSKKASQGQV